MLLALVLTSLCTYAIDNVVTGHARATVVDGITVVETQYLNFGSIDATAAVGTVTIAPDGTRTSSGGVLEIGSTFTSGSFTINGGPGMLLTYLLPSGSITLLGQNTGQPLTVSAFTTIDGTAPLNGTTDASGAAVLKVGATVTIPANQVADVYNGTYEVTISHD